MYSEGILLKAKIYIVLVQNLRNNQRERSGHLCLGKMFSPTGPNWVWKTSDFSTAVAAGNDTCTQSARNPVVANSNEF